MDIIEAISARRSIRNFTSGNVADEKVTTLLSAGMNAPSARNTQPWHFIVIRNRKILIRMTEICPNGSMLKSAPMAILVMGDLNLSEDYWIIDCSAATENILLAAEAEDLGACWVGVYPRETRVNGLKELFNLPDHIIPHSLVAVGYPAEKKEPNKKFQQNRVHFDKW